MFKLLKIVLFFIFIFNISLYSSQKTFKISYDPDYAPFSYLQNGKPEGLLIDYWSLWAEKNNYKIEFVDGNLWENAINLAKKGEVDFFLGTTPYEDWMIGSNPIYKTKTSLFINKDFSKGFSVDAPYLIGIIGRDHEDIIKKNFPNSQILIYENYASIFRDLNSKKIDIIFDDKTAVEFYALRNNFFHAIKPLDLLQNTSPIKAISKSKKLIEIFNEGLNNLTNEELYEIENKWILNNEQQIYKKTFELSPEEKEFIKNKRFNISVSNSWKPFIFKSTKDEPTGISFEIWQTLSKKLNIQSNYIYSNTFSKQLDSIKNKKNDVIFSAGETQDRKKYSLFTNSYLEFPLSIVTLKDENFIENINFLFDKKVAVGNNFTAHKLLKEKYPQLNFTTVKSVKEGLEKVHNGEVYAFVGMKPILIYNINKLELDDLKISGNTGVTFKLSIMIRDDYKPLQTALNKAIDSLEPKEISQIVSKWENVQFEESFNYKIFWGIIFIIFVIFTILIYINQMNFKRNKTLKHLVDERTKELKKLNYELERRVEIKTKELIRTNYILDEAQKIARLGSFSYNLQKKRLVWSDEHYKIFGLYPDEIKPSITKFLSFVHSDDIFEVKKQLFRAIKSDKRKVLEFKIVLRDGSIKFIQLSTKVTRFDMNNKPLFVVGTVFDLTKVKELELQKREKDSMLAQQSKMAALGEMLENIAHQWRQPLSVISTASTGLQLQLEMNNKIPNELLLQSVKSINEHSQYLSKTIDDFRNFFNPRKEKVDISIGSTIEKTLSLVSSRLKKENIHIHKNIEAYEIKTIESELIQVLLNIINNAIDALKSNFADNRNIFITVITKNKSLHIKIKDNAGGIPSKIIERVFEPYFTTKYKSQGTGIGLYMSNEIITKHLNGSISVKNSTYIHNEENQKGAIFTITIPININ